MNVEEIKELMTLFNDSNMTEFHLSNEEFEVQFSKREEYPQVVSNAVAPVANVASPVEAAPVSAAPSAEAQEAPQVATDANTLQAQSLGWFTYNLHQTQIHLYKWVNKSLQTTLYVLSKQ